MKKLLPLLIFIVLSLFITTCKEETEKIAVDYTKFVDPFIGTGGHGHTFPGATLPYGMVQLSPDTRTETWDGCSGYHYSDKSILGFSHTHFSGTGGGGGGDIMLMPMTGKVILTEGDTINTKTGYRSAFSHKNESAEPGYYKVLLDDYNTLVELTTTKRVGLHKYTFPGKTSEASIVFDLKHGISDSVDSLKINIKSKEISGFRAAKGSLAGNHTTYFVAKFSQPFKYYQVLNSKHKSNSKIAKGNDIKAYFTFNIESNTVIMVKVAISMVSVEGARKNLHKELPDWDFERVRQEAKENWQKELSKIDIEGATKAQQRIFYTAMYHAFIHPNIYMDVDRRYRSTNGKVYTADDFDDYTTFSLWDTFRALHPLQTIINREKTNQFIRTFISRYKRSKNMPIMEFSGNEMYSMIGYHSLPVVADAYVKGIRDYDTKAAYEGMKQLAESYRTGKNLYKKFGYIPYDKETHSVSKSLEYSYDDWCVAQVAKDFNQEDFNYFSLRGNFYQNLFCKETGFMRPKDSSHNWKDDFDPMTDTKDYTEGNAYQYTPFVPQDIEGLIALMGGDKNFEKWLDVEFTLEFDKSKIDIPDIAGLIGQYAQGNEPSHHIAYLYNYVGASWKTQKLIRQILTTLYSDNPDGMAGNEDAGQMSAWYILSSMGIYAVTPGMDYYVIGSPLFKKVTIHLENGKDFIIEAENNSKDRPYIDEVELNSWDYSKTYIKYTDIIEGGELSFTMSDKPNKEYGIEAKDRPFSLSYKATAPPVIKADELSFKDSTIVRVSCSDSKAVIRYTIDGAVPTDSSAVYLKPIIVKESIVIKTKTFSNDLNPSYPYSLTLRKMTLNPAIKISSAKRGLKYEYREGLCQSTKELQKIPITKTGIISSFNVDAIKDQRAFGYNFSGFLRVPMDGVYEFSLSSNDGAVLYIDDKVILDNDGFHPIQTFIEKTRLKKGYHKIKVDYFQMGRAKDLKVKWRKPGSSKFEELPAFVLYH